MNVGNGILRQPVFGAIMHEKSIGLRIQRNRHVEKQKNRADYFQRFFHTTRKVIGLTTISRLITIRVKIYTTMPKKRFEPVQVLHAQIYNHLLFFPVYFKHITIIYPLKTNLTPHKLIRSS